MFEFPLSQEHCLLVTRPAVESQTGIYLSVCSKKAIFPIAAILAREEMRVQDLTNLRQYILAASRSYLLCYGDNRSHLYRKIQHWDVVPQICWGFIRTVNH